MFHTLEWNLTDFEEKKTFFPLIEKHAKKSSLF